MNNFRQLAEETYRAFSPRDGNQHIASEYALERALKLIARGGARDILEVGLGIGSLSCTILLAKRRGLFRQSIRYSGTEGNDFCLRQLRHNLGADGVIDVQIFPDLAAVPREQRFDFVIVDGRDDNLEGIATLLNNGAVVFIEGDRRDQLAGLRALFPRSVSYRDIALRKNPAYGPFPREKWAGGCQVMYPQPTIFQRLDWIRNRIYTSLKYRLLRPCQVHCKVGTSARAS